MRLTGRAVLGMLVLLAALGAMGVAVADWFTGRSTRPPESRKAMTADPSGYSEFLKAVTPEGVLEHERRFQTIADAHGNTRVAGTPGYRESREYVAKRLRRAGYDVRVQSFENFFGSRGMKAETVDLKGRSDHGPFAAEDIPVGGLLSGAEGRKKGEQAEVYVE